MGGFLSDIKQSRKFKLFENLVFGGQNHSEVASTVMTWRNIWSGLWGDQALSPTYPGQKWEVGSGKVLH